LLVLSIIVIGVLFEGFVISIDSLLTDFGLTSR
jgi:hypothetical protein